MTASFGLAPDYVPGDLVRLRNYIPGSVTLLDMLLRREAAEALGKMVKAMKPEGLSPTVLPSYPSCANCLAVLDFDMRYPPKYGLIQNWFMYTEDTSLVFRYITAFCINP